LNETDAYPQGRVRNIMPTETDESQLYKQKTINAFLKDQDEAAQAQAMT